MNRKIFLSLLLLFLAGCGGAGMASLPAAASTKTEVPAEAPAQPETPPPAARTIVCWGDSLTSGAFPSCLAARFTPPRNVKNYGIGGETSSRILNRIEGHSLDGSAVSWQNGATVRLKTRRAVPARELDESYRGQWESFGLRIAEPERVEFFNLDGPIGSTTARLQAATVVSGSRFSAPGHPFSEGDEVYHLGAALPSGMYAGKVYFVRDPDTDGYSLAEFPGEGPVSFGAGSVTTLGPFYYDWEYRGEERTLKAVTHTDTDAADAVLWMGANNIKDTATVKADIAAAYAKLSRAGRVLVLTCIANDQAVSGTVAFHALSDVNAWILAQYPENSVDIYSYLRSKYNPALPQDVADFDAGVIPSSLRVDTVHLNTAGNNHVADKVYEFFVSRGWQ